MSAEMPALAAATQRQRRDIVTPEGVALPFELAEIGDRATAFAIDQAISIVATIAIYVVGFVVVIRNLDTANNSIGFAATLSIVFFTAFMVRNLYFIHFELAWQGATPGKRAVGIRVVDRRGGPLMPMAVIARNLTREIEFFIPFGMLTSFGGGHTPWEKLALAAWLLLFSALPFFTRDRMRAGDLLAGTMVIRMPRRVLLPDLIEQTAHYAFQDHQLEAYGAFELQVLEDVLRRADAPGIRELRVEVADRIRAKIGWQDKIAAADVDRFLIDFYAAQRAYLERGQLYGKFRADKNAIAGRKPI
jgi:uncharacterized RDD family membrane protein YckC